MTRELLDRLMREYRDNVRALFDKGSPDFVDNSSPRHAAVLIEEMVAHAQKSFVAFAGRMNPEVWTPTVMAALGAALGRGVAIRLLVEKECEPITNGTMPEPVRKFVYRLGDSVADKVKDISHFASGDGESLRLEMDPDRKTAVFAAKNPEVASRLGNIFDGLCQMGVAYDAA